MWNVTIQVEGNDVCFKLDTGAEVTVVGEKVLHSLNSKNYQQQPRGYVGLIKHLWKFWEKFL